MRIAFLDCFSGISGDMFLGALVDAGVSFRLLQDTVAALNLGATLEVSRVSRSGISATKVDVVVRGNKDLPREQYWTEQRDSGRRLQVPGIQRETSYMHSHEQVGEHDQHGLGHEHGHSHHHDTHAGHEHSHDHAHSHEHGRGLAEIKGIIAGAPISARAKKVATAAFDALGKAEAKIHNSSPEKIHFHEVGAVDALVDVICGAVGADALAVDRWACSPLNVGGGAVECAHGRFPIPAPATLELLKDAPIYSSGAQVELVTPTGAALVRALAPEFCAFPPMQVSSVGYGAGSRDLPGAANVLRISIGESRDLSRAGERQHSHLQDQVTVLEASIDDLNPQLFGHVMERALASGALDVFAAPLHMKKNRPGMLLTVLARPEEAEALAQLIFTETTTLGIRIREERRLTLERQWVPVRTQWGEVRIKVACLNGAMVNYAPEYEDCRRVASEHGVPLKSVMQEAVTVYLGGLPRGHASSAPGQKQRHVSYRDATTPEKRMKPSRE